MKKNKTAIMIAALIVLTAVLACVHFAVRTPAADGSLLVEAGGTVTEVPLSALELGPVQGTVVNGKGEERTIDAEGVPLAEVLEQAAVSDYTAVDVIADDEYSAEVTAQEIASEGKVYLIVSDDNALQLLVFGDENSKRNVSNVVRLVVT